MDVRWTELDDVHGRKLRNRQVGVCRGQFEVAQLVVFDEEEQERFRGERFEHDSCTLASPTFGCASNDRKIHGRTGAAGAMADYAGTRYLCHPPTAVR
jgi:hypothetical protein